MIIDSIIGMAFKFIWAILDSLKIPSLSFDISVLTPFFDIMSNIFYFIPIAYVWPIINFIVFMQGYRITIALFRLLGSIWDVIPSM